MNTDRSLYEIEVALAKSDSFNFIHNIIAFNVHGLGESLNIQHECDMLVLSKSGYLTEIEIKRSWTDFLADFKKRHNHEGRGLIKYFYYCVPEIIYGKVLNYICDNEIKCSGIITYDESLLIKINGCRYRSQYPNDRKEYYTVTGLNMGGRKLYLEEQLQVARYGAMRAIKLKEKFINAYSHENKSS